MKKTRRELVQNWIKGKGFHTADVASVMDWYDKVVEEGREPEDKEIMEKAQEFYSKALSGERARLFSEKKMLRKAAIKLSGLILLGSTLGGMLSEFIMENGELWQDLATIVLRWLQAG